MIKLKDLIKEFVPGTLLDTRKKPGDYWKGAISDTWYARSPEYGWRSSYDTEEEAKMWAEEGKDLEGNNEETAEHPPEPIEETVNEAASYPSFEVDKNIRYKDTVVAKGYWTYTGKESGGKGVYLNTSNQQRLGFDKDDLSYFKKHLPDHFQINEVIKGKFVITNKAKDSFMKPYRKGLLGSKWTNNKKEGIVNEADVKKNEPNRFWIAKSNMRGNTGVIKKGEIFISSGKEVRRKFQGDEGSFHGKEIDVELADPNYEYYEGLDPVDFKNLFREVDPKKDSAAMKKLNKWGLVDIGTQYYVGTFSIHRGETAKDAAGRMLSKMIPTKAESPNGAVKKVKGAGSSGTMYELGRGITAVMKWKDIFEIVLTEKTKDIKPQALANKLKKPVHSRMGKEVVLVKESVNEGKTLFIKNNKEISKIIRSSKKGDIFTVWAKGPATFKDEVGVFQNVGMMTDFGSKRRLPAFQELGSAGKPKELYITGIRKITIGDTIGKSTND